MATLPHTVGAEQTIEFAQQLLRKYHVRHLPVLHGGEVVGIVSDRDLGLAAGLPDVDPKRVTVEETMTQEVYRVSADEPLGEVIAQMAEHKYGSALVLDGPKVVGIFTTHDVLTLARELLQG